MVTVARRLQFEGGSLLLWACEGLQSAYMLVLLLPGLLSDTCIPIPAALKRVSDPRATLQ